jgi:hypothetical protein
LRHENSSTLIAMQLTPKQCDALGDLSFKTAQQVFFTYCVAGLILLVTDKIDSLPFLLLELFGAFITAAFLYAGLFFTKKRESL